MLLLRPNIIAVITRTATTNGKTNHIGIEPFDAQTMKIEIAQKKLIIGPRMQLKTIKPQAIEQFASQINALMGGHPAQGDAPSAEGGTAVDAHRPALFIHHHAVSVNYIGLFAGKQRNNTSNGILIVQAVAPVNESHHLPGSGTQTLIYGIVQTLVGTV